MIDFKAFHEELQEIVKLAKSVGTMTANAAKAVANKSKGLQRQAQLRAKAAKNPGDASAHGSAPIHKNDAAIQVRSKAPGTNPQSVQKSIARNRAKAGPAAPAGPTPVVAPKAPAGAPVGASGTPAWHKHVGTAALAGAGLIAARSMMKSNDQGQ